MCVCVPPPQQAGQQRRHSQSVWHGAESCALALALAARALVCLGAWPAGGATAAASTTTRESDAGIADYFMTAATLRQRPQERIRGHGAVENYDGWGSLSL